MFLDLVHESNESLHNDLLPSEVIVKEEPVNISEGEIREDHYLVNQEFSLVNVKEEPVLEFFETEIYQGEIPNNNQDIKEEYELSEPIMKEAEPRTTPTPLPAPALPPSTSPTPAITTPWSYDDMKALVKNCVEEGKGLKCFPVDVLFILVF